MRWYVYCAPPLPPSVPGLQHHHTARSSSTLKHASLVAWRMALWCCRVGMASMSRCNGEQTCSCHCVLQYHRRFWHTFDQYFGGHRIEMVCRYYDWPARSENVLLYFQGLASQATSTLGEQASTHFPAYLTPEMQITADNLAFTFCCHPVPGSKGLRAGSSQ